MPLPSSGQVSLSDIAAEFGGVVPHSMSEYLGAAAGVPASGRLRIRDFYGKSNDVAISATGGTISDSGGYRYHTFTSGGTFTVNSAAAGAFSNTVDTLILAAGGGVDVRGSTNSTGQYGGGGGGGMVETSFAASVGSKTVSIGQGVTNDSGQNSSVTSLTTAIGGGAGGYQNSKGFSGGSGGGSGNGHTGGSGTAGQGNKGGDSFRGGFGGGGGGAGAAGGSPHPSSYIGGNGGNGKAWLNGITYAGGGSGGGFVGPPGSAGTGGGGRSGPGTFYGGGAGAGNLSNATHILPGYQGIVIFRYQI